MTPFFKPLFLFLLLAIASVLPAQVVVNEFSCSNFSAHTDNFGRYEDFIELYNTGATAFDISAYHLSDKLNNPTKWQFPAGSIIPANGYIRIWASGKDLVNGNHIHSNFRLTQTQTNPEYVVFSDPSGTILESYNLHNHITQNNHSFGRSPDGAPNWHVFTSATPNTSNGTTSYERYAIPPTFSISGGFYTGTQTLNITTTEPNSVIRYTINGTTPTSSSPVFNNPITISSTTVVKARVFSNASQILPSLIEFHTFFINTNHNIPVVSISGSNVPTLMQGSMIKPHGFVEYYENGQLQTKVAGEFNKHGNDSWAYAQRGIDFISRDEFGSGDALRYQIFAQSNRTNFQRVMFKAAANDNYPFEVGAHIRDAFIHELSQRANLELDERTYEPCVLYVNGQYWGLYETREKADDHDFTSYYYDQERDDLYYLKTWGATWSEYGGPAAQTDWNNLLNYIQNNNMGDPTHYAYVANQLNLLSLIDYFIINTHTVCMDWLNWNTAWWRGTNPNGQAQKWRYVLWDMDATFGHYINYTGIPNTSPTADPCFGENLNNPGGQGHTTIMKKLIDESPAFKQMYLNRYINLTNTHLHCDNMIILLDELIDRIAPEMPAQIARWGGNLNAWQTQVQNLKNFILQRCAFFNQGFVDCYNLAGPFNVTFNVSPAGAGNISVNNQTFSSYPHTGSYIGGIPNTMNASSNPGYLFSHWEIQNNVISPNLNTSNVNVTFNAADNIIAHFVQVGSPKQLTFIVSPPNSGTIDIDGFTPAIYPWTGTFPDNTTLNPTAQAAPSFMFSHWTSQNTTLLPNNNSENISFSVNSNDTIIAYFIEENNNVNLTLNIQPPLAGKILLNNTFSTSSLQTFQLNINDNINLKAENSPSFLFSHWTLNNHILQPNNFEVDVDFVITQNEFVTAHFIVDENIISVPNAFSPDGDGINDFFTMFSSQALESCDVYIYNRWGEQLFYSNDISFAWDGTFNGVLCPADVYTYVIIYKIIGVDKRYQKAGSTLLIW